MEKYPLNVKEIANPDGLMMIGIPNRTLPVLQAISRKTGTDMANIISIALSSIAEKVLTKQDMVELAEEIRRMES